MVVGLSRLRVVTPHARIGAAAADRHHCPIADRQTTSPPIDAMGPAPRRTIASFDTPGTMMAPKFF
jgi:hypothetical protein